jgi:hypothetical protein
MVEDHRVLALGVRDCSEEIMKRPPNIVASICVRSNVERKRSYSRGSNGS